MTQNDHRTYGVIRQRNTWNITPPQKVGNITLIQLADITGDKRWTSRPHVQLCHEIMLQLSGEAVVTCNEDEFRQQAGQLSIIPEGVIHSVSFTGSKPTRIQIAGFHFQHAAQDFISRQSGSRGRTYDLRPGSQEIQVLLNMLLNEYFDNSGRPNEPVRSLLNLLLLCIDRSMNAPLELPPKGDVVLENTDDSLTLRLSQYLRDNALEISSLRELSGIFMYSYSYLSHHFSAHAGYSLKSYWERYRFQECIRLMHDDSLSLTQIAKIAGFQSIHTFSRAFFQTFGVSPSKYRQLIARQAKK